MADSEDRQALPGTGPGCPMAARLRRACWQLRVACVDHRRQLDGWFATRGVRPEALAAAERYLAAEGGGTLGWLGARL